MVSRIACVVAAIHEIEAVLAGLCAWGNAPAEGAQVSATFERAMAQAAASRRPPVCDSADEVDGVIHEAAARVGLEEPLLRAVIKAESGFDPNCVSPAGARGLMQLMPDTARALGVSDPFDPRENVMAGARYLRQQLERFGRVDLALAAYNAGPGAVTRYAGIPPFAETQAYVPRVLRYWREFADQARGR
jgi:soluble lytic murein transglycosylase-like protein